MAHHRTRVLVAYHHAILAQHPGQALGSTPDVIVLEAGGPLTPDQLMARTSCPTIIDVDLGSTESHAFRRETFPARPADLVARIATFTGRRVRHRRGADGADGRGVTDQAAAAPVAVPVVSDDADAGDPATTPAGAAQPLPASGSIA